MRRYVSIKGKTQVMIIVKNNGINGIEKYLNVI